MVGTTRLWRSARIMSAFYLTSFRRCCVKVHQCSCARDAMHDELHRRFAISSSAYGLLWANILLSRDYQVTDFASSMADTETPGHPGGLCATYCMPVKSGCAGSSTGIGPTALVAEAHCPGWRLLLSHLLQLHLYLTIVQ